LVGYAEGQDLSLALVGLQALDQIGSEDCVTTYVGLLTSPELPIRKTALKALAKWPVQATEAAKTLSTQGTRNMRIGIELLGELGTPDALKLVADQLKSKDPGARMEAVRVLATKDATTYGPLITPLKYDPDPDVRLLADWALRPKT
jgi:HEAT repeat protein